VEVDGQNPVRFSRDDQNWRVVAHLGVSGGGWTELSNQLKSHFGQPILDESNLN
jgi:hypothetical protein